MKIDIGDVLSGKYQKKKIEFEENLGIYDYDGFKLNFLKPIVFNGEVASVAENVFLKGILTFEFESPCHRCLESFKSSYEVEVYEELTRAEDEDEGNELEDSFAIVCDLLDMSKIVRNLMALTLPLKLICNEDCKGLCPKCGKNLNSGQCGCEGLEIDERLSKLQEFLDSNKEV